MVAGVVLISILSGLAAAGAALVAGTSPLMALLFYVLGGLFGVSLLVLRACIPSSTDP